MVSKHGDLTDYRQSAREQERVADLMRLIPAGCRSALDVGARDGYLSLKLADVLESVTALDLDVPKIEHPRIAAVKGDATALQFADRSFDVVLCAEVLEHIPPRLLATACSELARVARVAVIVGVPYRQDLRHGRTLCLECGKRNPPWGHVNAFDEVRLPALFPVMTVDATSFVGTTMERTNSLSAWLMDRARNPYGTYEQEEPCVHCGAAIAPPTSRSLMQKMCSKAALLIDAVVRRCAVRPQPNWIHMRLRAPT